MKKRFLITGGLGFIGKAITHSLITKNHNVKIIDNKFRNPNPQIIDNKNCKIYYLDIRNKNEFKKISKDVDTVIHLAAINGTNFFYENPYLVLEVAIKGIINLLEVCKENNISEFFFASSSEVYHNPPYFPADEKVPLIIPDPFNPRYSYSTGKIVSEILLLNTNFLKRLIIFRPHNIYGPDMGSNHVIPELISKIIKSKKIIDIQGTGNQTRSFCYIDDFIKGFNILLQKGKNKNIYNIGSNEELKIIHLAEKLIQISKKNLNIKKTKKIIGSPERRKPNIKKISKLGYKPSISLNKGLNNTFKWYNNYFDNEL